MSYPASKETQKEIDEIIKRVEKLLREHKVGENPTEEFTYVFSLPTSAKNMEIEIYEIIEDIENLKKRQTK